MIHRRRLLTGGLALAAVHRVTSRTASAQSLQAQGRTEQQVTTYDYYSSGEVHQMTSFVISAWTNPRTANALRRPVRPIKLGVRYNDPEQIGVEPKRGSHGFNGAGFVAVQRTRYSVYIPCRPKDRRLFRMTVIAYNSYSTGSTVKYRGDGYPGRWIRLKLAKGSDQ